MIEGIRIRSVYAGRVETCWMDKPPSAIRKQKVSDRVAVAEHGLTCDAQADLSVHGGPDKALHHYPAEHYQTWRAELGREDLHPGGFGENISTTGLTEDTVCIGDVFVLGSAIVQVSQGRQPCWKLNAHTREERMAWFFQKSGRTGWYYRVLSPGTVASGDIATLKQRPQPSWTVKRATAARLTRKVTPAEATELATLPELAEGWRLAFARIARGNRKEDTSGRLQSPSVPRS